MKTVTAGYGTTLMSTRSVELARNPAMRTPGNRACRDGLTMSRSSAPPARPAYRMPPGYATFVQDQAPTGDDTEGRAPTPPDRIREDTMKGKAPLGARILRDTQDWEAMTHDQLIAMR